jgi:predicted transcriptional regulator
LKPIDYRNANWIELRGKLAGARQAVYNALYEHGPCTTRQLAERAEIDVCSVRPRITELLDLCLAQCDGADGGEGRYRAIALQEAEDAFRIKCLAGRTGQLTLL